MDESSSRRTAYRYWLMVLILVALGFLTIFSIGIYLWFIAVALIVMSPFRSRPRTYRSGMALFLGFLIGYVLIAPWGCSQTFTSDLTTGEETLSPVVCTSPIGVEYSGPEPFDPSRTLALVAGGVAALVASTATWLGTASRNSKPS
jgi:peptidoglycan/LPS O-acetylase OafA/YrhL